MGQSTLFIVVIVLLAFFFFWNWRNNRKRRAAEDEKAARLVKGVEVMTNSGIFGTVDSVDLDNNKVVLEISPGNLLTVHRQAISRIETPAEAPVEAATANTNEVASSSIDEANAQAQAEAAKTAQQPEFGERIQPSKHDE